ncbi:ImmA/IrrE family metallo-endopeptidase [Myxococcus stipitatus]|uniref:ImmA/IrrE family metallo-endopeptidase n=1 Tax=Myxococcus stipitatus TaxID=83455 RepID=UPI0030D54D18
MTEHWLEEAVAASRLPAPQVFPRNLASEVERRLGVTLVARPQLTSDSVRDWLAQRHFRHRVAETSRRLFGCMVARRGRAVLFLDSTDSLDEQRFTLAHEVAHFVLDHLLPRRWALSVFGESIRPVLDKTRSPTPAEKLSSHFSQIPIGIQVKLMERGPSGAIRSTQVLHSERRADRLAYELLAPSTLAQETLGDRPEEEGALELAGRFGLTHSAAREYAQMLLLHRRPPRFSLARMLGGDRR